MLFTKQMYERPCLLNIQRPWHAANYSVQYVIDNLDGYDRLAVCYNDCRLPLHEIF